jgi:signal transduction histidine kinase
MLPQLHLASPIWVYFTVSIMFSSLIVAAIASTIRRFVRVAHGLVSVVYVLALVSWPFAVIDATKVPNEHHWLYYLLTVATATASIAFSTRVATIYLFVVPMIYGAIRMTPAGGGSSLTTAILDSVYAIILGGAVMIIVTMLRQASAAVDRAQATALDRYGHAVRQHATEVERVQVDSIVHDSVLTTLLSAARAFSPESKALAARMATSAIGHLYDAAHVQPDDGSTVRLRDISTRITDVASSTSTPFALSVRDVGPRSIPVQASEAVYSAAVQAIVNSIQHAGSDHSIERWLSIQAVRPGGILVEIGDKGEGFDIAAIPNERLGVRVSIIERVANAGGHADIQSAPGKGTRVTIRWAPSDLNQVTAFQSLSPELVLADDEDD